MNFCRFFFFVMFSTLVALRYFMSVSQRVKVIHPFLIRKMIVAQVRTGCILWSQRPLLHSCLIRRPRQWVLPVWDACLSRLPCWILRQVLSPEPLPRCISTLSVFLLIFLIDSISVVELSVSLAHKLSLRCIDLFRSTCSFGLLNAVCSCLYLSYILFGIIFLLFSYNDSSVYWFILRFSLSLLNFDTLLMSAHRFCKWKRNRTQKKKKKHRNLLFNPNNPKFSIILILSLFCTLYFCICSLVIQGGVVENTNSVMNLRDKKMKEQAEKVEKNKRNMHAHTVQI